MPRTALAPAILLALFAAGLAVPAAAQPATDQLAFEPVAGGLGQVTAIAHAGDDRLFLTERSGRIQIIRDGERLDGAFLDLLGRVGSAGQEQGLLGLAFHPRYADTGWLFVNYTDLAGDTVLSRFSVSGTDPNRADPDSEAVLLRIPQPFSNHNGGQLAFGPDGYLYVGLGDGGASFDPGCNAQDLGSLLGKILRLDVDTAAAAPPHHSVPADNPFVATPGARPEIWAYGLRNPWRFSFDRATGEMYIGDVGQGAVEEIDLQPAGLGGRNYGWKMMEGPRCTGRTDGCPAPLPPCEAPQLVLPLLSYEHQQGRCSVTGGSVYRGRAIAGLQGAYLYGDFCSGEVWALSRSSDGLAVSKLPSTVPFLTTFGEDADGEIHLSDGPTLYRLTGPSTPPPPPPPEPCDDEDPASLCLLDGRFQVQASFSVGQGPSRLATADRLTPDSGYFWFFDLDNVEVVVKMVDACAAFDRFWVFAAGLTNVNVDLRIVDTETGAEATYTNPFGTPFAPIQDTEAFETCDGTAVGQQVGQRPIEP